MDERGLLLTDALWDRSAEALAWLESRRGAPPDLSDREFAGTGSGPPSVCAAAAGWTWASGPAC